MFKSRVSNCIIQMSEEDRLANCDLFYVRGDEVLANLDRYAIIPVEEYNKLMSQIKRDECYDCEYKYSK